MHLLVIRVIFKVIFKLVDTRSVETGFLRGLGYANVSLAHSGVDAVRNYSARTRLPEPNAVYG